MRHPSQDVDDGFGEVQIKIPEMLLYIRERTIIGPVFQVHILHFLSTHGIQIQIPARQRRIEIPG